MTLHTDHDIDSDGINGPLHRALNDVTSAAVAAAKAERAYRRLALSVSPLVDDDIDSLDAALGAVTDSRRALSRALFYYASVQ